MALDRFITFHASVPTSESIDALLRNFVGEAGTIEKQLHPQLDHWIITLPGHLTFALADEPTAMTNFVHLPFVDDDRGRWIEVFIHHGPLQIDVLTRQMDEFTNAVADGIANVITRYWQGSRDVE